MATTTQDKPDLAAPKSASGSPHPTMDRIVQGAHETVDRAAEKATPAVERLQASACEAAEALKAKAEAMRELQNEWVANCRTTVRARPLTSIAAALAAGLVLGRLLGR